MNGHLCKTNEFSKGPVSYLFHKLVWLHKRKGNPISHGLDMAVSLCLDRERIREIDSGLSVWNAKQPTCKKTTRKAQGCMCAFFLHLSTYMYGKANAHFWESVECIIQWQQRFGQLKAPVDWGLTATELVIHMQQQQCLFPVDKTCRLGKKWWRKKNQFLYL